MLRALAALVLVLNAGQALALDVADLEGRWRVTRLEGVPLPADAKVDIEFRRDGQAGGRGGCNRFAGPYTLSGDALAFGNLATTRMACPEPLMETESRFLALLASVTRALPGEDGGVALLAGDRPVLLLERTP